MVELDAVTKSYGRTRVLGPLSLALPAHSTTVLIGPSGCGKSTLLRIVLGLLAPTSGTVRFEGRPLASLDLGEARRRMGYVIQDGGLFPHMTARDNASVMANHLGWEPAKIRDRLAALCELTRLPIDLLDRYPAEISGGQRQRVSLMRALMLDPSILLLDEPLTALDPMIRSDLQDDLKRVFENLGKTVVLVTHDLAEATFFSDTLVLLRDGRIVQRGTFAELSESPADPFVTRFIKAQRRTPETTVGPTPPPR